MRSSMMGRMTRMHVLFEIVATQNVISKPIDGLIQLSIQINGENEIGSKTISSKKQQTQLGQ